MWHTRKKTLKNPTFWGQNLSCGTLICLHRLEICWKNCRYRFSKEMYICHWTRLQVKDLIIPRQRKWRSVKECPSFVLWSVQHYQLVCQRFPWNSWNVVHFVLVKDLCKNITCKWQQVLMSYNIICGKLYESTEVRQRLAEVFVCFLSYV